MKAISLWQPWASLMAAGYKRIETRSWAPRGLRTGDLVAIHAAKHWTEDERDVCLDEPFKRCLSLAQARGLWSFEHPPLGCVVAIARFHHVAPTLGGFDYDRMNEEEYAFGDYRDGRFGWVFSAVRPIEPIPLRGERFLFDWLPPCPFPYGLPHLEPWNFASGGKAGA